MPWDIGEREGPSGSSRCHLKPLDFRKASCPAKHSRWYHLPDVITPGNILHYSPLPYGLESDLFRLEFKALHDLIPVLLSNRTNICPICCICPVPNHFLEVSTIIHTHTHTHICVYMYIYDGARIYIWWVYNVHTCIEVIYMLYHIYIYMMVLSSRKKIRNRAKYSILDKYLFGQNIWLCV